MPDFAYDEMKKLFPGASDDEVMQKIASIDQPQPQVIEGPDTLITANAPNPYKDMAIQNVKDKYGLDDKYSNDARQKLVDEVKQSASGPNWAAGLAAFGTGLAGGNAAAAGESFLRRQKEDRENQINQFDAGRKQALISRDDAANQEKIKRENMLDSPESLMAQDLAIQMGMDPIQAKGLTAAKFKDFSPVMEKKYQIAENNKTRIDLAHEGMLNRKNALDVEKLKHEGDSQDRALTSAQQLLESARGNPAAAQAERDLYAADKANSLAKLMGDPKNLTQRMVNLYTSEIGKIATGGVPTVSELEGLDPHTLTGSLSRVWEKLSGNPTPANLGEFVKEYQAYSNAVAKDAQKVIQDKYGRVIEARKDQLGPKHYKSLQDQYLNRFNPPASVAGDIGSSGSNSGAPPETKIVGSVKYKKVPGGWEEVH